jgi:hypothetical protein
MTCKTGCGANKAAWLSAINSLQAFRQQIIADLKTKRRADWYELLNPKELRGSFSNLVVTYFDFPIWLFRFDNNNIRGFEINISSYKYQRDKHINDVSALLGNFLGMDTGKVLRDALFAAGHELSVYPFFNFERYPIPPFEPLGLNSTAHGVPAKPGIVGVDSIIMFSPHMWGRDGKPGNSGYSGPGSEADEVLFHEMIHGLRTMMGVSAANNSSNDEYNNEEEFIAVVVTNIYLAEKRKMILRGGHEGFSALPQPSEFLKNAQHKRLLRNFRNAQRDFFDALADISEGKVWWNPVRELRDAGG